MRVKLIREASMPAAMATVRREFGDDALILGSRSLRGGGVEVTVARDESADDPEPLTRVAPMRMPEYGERAEAPLPNLQKWHGFELPELEGAESPEHETMVLARYLRIGALDLARGAAPVIMCGIPGGGKTLAITRLATRLVLSGRDPLVVTMDTERSGAFEQLSACMDILDVELRAVDTPEALKDLYEREGHNRIMLVDTFGVSPWDDALLERLVQIKAAVNGALTVVHPAGGHVEETCDALSVFREIGAQNVIVSKTDCTRRMGNIVQASLDGMTLAEVSMGRGVIDGLRPVTPKVLHHVLVDMRKRGAGMKYAKARANAGRRERSEPRAEARPKAASWGARAPLSQGADVLTRHMLAQGRV